jgi:hypothetical protein
MSLYAFHLGQITSTVLGQPTETDHTQKRCFYPSAIYETMKALAVLRCLYGSKIVLLAMVIGTFEIHSRDISQENYHACNTHNQTPICGLL